jgi:hypothetical protein
MTTTQTATAARFTLDETRVAEWLAAQMAQYERWEAGKATEAPELEIGPGFNPRDDWASDGHDVQSVLYFAHVNGIITGPGSVEFDYVNDGDAGYTWLVYLDGPGSLKLSTYYSPLRNLGDGSEPGAPAALGVLREAVEAANGVLDDLAAYIAAQQAA